MVTIVSFADIGTYLYQNGQYTPIFAAQQGFNAVSSSALNNVGQILGTNAGGTYVYTNGVIGAFPFYPYGVATDINDAGIIVGGDAIATPVPEPGSLLLFAGGLVALELRRRARR